MKNLFFILFCLFFIPTTAYSQDIADKKFWIVNGVFLGSVVYDVESSYFALDRCENKCKEGNPLIRPFAEKGRLWVYAYHAPIGAGVMYYSYYLKKNGKKWWFLPPVIITAVHVTAGTWNIKYALSF